MNFLTSERVDRTDQTYVTISEVLTRMAKSGIFELCGGYCISMSDMVRTALKQRGIESKPVEVTLTITYHSHTPADTVFVGFNEVGNPGEIDTHVILVTDTTPPYIIDASIPHRLPKGILAVIELITAADDMKLIDRRFRPTNISMIYEQKTRQIVPMHHQESIIARINTDRKIFKNLGYLKILIILALTISALNLIRGSYDFYQVYLNEQNARGPSGIKLLNDRLDNLENLIKKTNK